MIVEIQIAFPKVTDKSSLRRNFHCKKNEYFPQNMYLNKLYLTKNRTGLLYLFHLYKITSK